MTPFLTGSDCKGWVFHLGPNTPAGGSLPIERAPGGRIWAQTNGQCRGRACHAPCGQAADRMSFTIGMTLLPYSEIASTSWPCGIGPVAYFRSKRWIFSACTVAAILRATVSGDPT